MQNAEINATSAARARFNFDLGMLFAQVSENRIKIADEFNVYTFLFIPWNLIPARFRPVAVVIPFEKGNFIVGQ